MLKKALVLTAVAAWLMLLGVNVSSAKMGQHQNTYTKKVIVCKWVGTPGEDEVLQTGQNPIAVSTNALEGKGFAGEFPFEFSDAQGRSVAVRYATGPTDNGDLVTDCGGEPSETPSPTVTQTPSPTDTPSPSETGSPSPSTTHTGSPTSTSTSHTTTTSPHSRSGSKKPEQKTAFTGFSTPAAVAFGALLLAGLGALGIARRFAKD